MRKVLLVLVTVLLSAALLVAVDFHIGVVTGTVSQSGPYPINRRRKE
jgi:hypothetical protein